MKFDKKSPCESCPYRRDARQEFWHPAEFVGLLANDADPVMGKMYACHEGKKLAHEDRSMCAGWLLDQKRRGLPSIQLRLLLTQSEEARAMLEEVNADGLDLYDSIEEMCEANGVES